MNLLEELRNNSEYINEKQFGDISSFNFNRKVFFSGKWNNISKFARGLFLNNKTGKIIARSYEKFFNYNENIFNTNEFLKETLIFPVVAYKKYNGFLGILSLNTNNELLFCSKSTIENDYVNYFKNIFYEKAHNVEYLKKYLKENNCNLIFEVIDYKNDPHIVEYFENNIILLDIIKLDEKFDNFNYNELQKLGKNCNFNVKSIEYIFNNFDELFNFIKKFENDFTEQQEGYVLVDKNNYHFKLKGKWYKFWKHMRSLKDRIAKNKTVNLNNDLLANKFITWCKLQNSEYLLNNNIIKLRNKFLKDNN